MRSMRTELLNILILWPKRAQYLLIKLIKWIQQQNWNLVSKLVQFVGCQKDAAKFVHWRKLNCTSSWHWSFANGRLIDQSALTCDSILYAGIATHWVGHCSCVPHFGLIANIKEILIWLQSSFSLFFLFI